MNATYKTVLIIAAAFCLVVVLYYSIAGDDEQPRLTDAEGGTGTEDTTTDDKSTEGDSTTTDTDESSGNSGAPAITPPEPPAGRSESGGGRPSLRNPEPAETDDDASLSAAERIRRSVLEARERASNPVEDVTGSNGSGANVGATTEETSTGEADEGDEGIGTTYIGPIVPPGGNPDEGSADGGIGETETDRSITDVTSPGGSPPAPVTTEDSDDGVTPPPPVDTESTPSPRRTTSGRDYEIQPGETFSSIAIREYGDESKWIDIAQANPTVDPTRLQVGQVIRLPDVSADRETPTRDEVERNEPMPAGAVPYRVKTGDTLSSIAKQYYGDETQWRRIYEANRAKIGANPNRLKLDMVLAIPAAGSGAR